MLRRQLGKKQFKKPVLCIEQLLCASTFSGIGTAEKACEVVRVPLDKMLGSKHTTRTVGLTELALLPRSILMKMFEESCIFDDVLDGIGLSMKNYMKIPTVKKRMRRVLRSGKVKKKHWCYNHGKRRKRPWRHLEIGGSPCVAHSKIGKKAGTKHHTFFTFLMWARKIKDDEVPVSIHENVGSFPDSAIDDAFPTPRYKIYVLCVKTSDVGYQKMCRRDRKFHIIYDTTQVKVNADPRVLYLHVKDLLGTTNATRCFSDCLKIGCRS